MANIATSETQLTAKLLGLFFLIDHSSIVFRPPLFSHEHCHPAEEVDARP